ncbi:agmatinase [bacterium]|nr:agmatinase [bacterium]
MRFGDFPPQFTDYDQARIVLLPVPFEKTCSWLPGTAQGPSAILQASPYLEWYDIETGVEVYREGIFTAPAVLADTSEEMVEKVYRQVEHYAQEGKFVVTLGGEHAVSYPAVKALVEKQPSLSVLQLDAHGDTRDAYEGSKLSHACVMARIREQVSNVVVVGIRSIDASEMPILDTPKTFFAHRIHDSADWIDRAVDELNDPVYVTIDIDVFDPSEVPATGTPEPGGLRWWQVMGLLHRVAQKRKVIGFDLVELSAGHKPSEFLGAKLVYTFLSHLHKHHSWEWAS